VTSIVIRFLGADAAPDEIVTSLEPGSARGTDGSLLPRGINPPGILAAAPAESPPPDASSIVGGGGRQGAGEPPRGISDGPAGG
jgi:hypothetical protein